MNSLVGDRRCNSNFKINLLDSSRMNVSRITVFLCVLCGCIIATAQTKVSSLQEVRKISNSNHINLGDSGLVHWNYKYQVHPSKNAFKQSNLQIAYVQGDQEIWNVTIYPEGEYVKFANRVSATADGNYVYVLYKQFYYSKKSDYVYLVQRIDKYGDVESFEIDGDKDLERILFMYCDNNHLNIYTTTHNNSMEGKNFIDNWNPRIFKLDHESLETSIYDVQLEADPEHKIGMWDLIGVTGDTAVFSSKDMNFSSGYLMDRIVKIGPYGKKLSESKIELQFPSAISEITFGCKSDIKHSRNFPEVYTYYIEEYIDYRKHNGKGNVVDHEVLPVRSFYSLNNNRVMYAAVSGGIGSPKLMLVIVDQDGNVIKSIEQFPGNNRSNLVGQDFMGMTVDEEGNFYITNYKKTIMRIDKEGTESSADIKMNPINGIHIPLFYRFHKTPTFQMVNNKPASGLKIMSGFDKAAPWFSSYKGSEYVAYFNSKEGTYDLYLLGQ